MTAVRPDRTLTDEQQVQRRIAEMTPAPGEVARRFADYTRRTKERDLQILRAAGVPDFVPYGAVTL